MLIRLVQGVSRQGIRRQQQLGSITSTNRPDRSFAAWISLSSKLPRSSVYSSSNQQPLNSSRLIHTCTPTHIESSPPLTSSTPSPSPPPPPAPVNDSELTDALIQSYADRAARPVSLKAMLAMGSRPAYLLTAAQWLWQELPVRLAKRLRDLEDLPFGLSKSVEVQNLMKLYRTSLSEALSIPCPTCSSEELQFTEVIKNILTRHQQVIVDLASGINGGFLRSRSGSLTPNPLRSNQQFLLQEFLDRFNSSRIGLRLLLAQHVALHTPRPNMVGVIEIGCNPSRIIQQAINDAQQSCANAYGYSLAPKVELTDVSAKDGGIKDFNYVSAHLRFMVFELLKNAMRATVEHARKKKAIAQGWKPDEGVPQPAVELTPSDLPPIQVVIVDGPTDVTIKISDRGGGIKRSELPLVFTYTYSATQKNLTLAQIAAQKLATTTNNPSTSSTAATSPSTPSSATTSNSNSPASTTTSSSTSTSSSSPPSDWLTGAIKANEPVLNTQLHDFVEAFGLPITRLYARFLGGDLQLFSLNGHGTDAYLYINKLGDYQEVIQD